MAEQDNIPFTFGKLTFGLPTINVITASDNNAKPTISAIVNTGLCDSATGCPVFAKFDDCGELIEHFYINTNGEEVVTNTGFQKAGGSTFNDAVYETLATGVIERLNRCITKDSKGAEVSRTYTQFGDGSAYTVADATLIFPTPQKIQMGEETFDVTGASTPLPNIPTAANSQGQNFPQHAYIHVEVDSDNTAQGISYTTDGTDPAESATAKEFEVSQGNGFQLDTWDEIDGFRAVPLDGNGDPDPALTIQASVEYNNISPDKDDV